MGVDRAWEINTFQLSACQRVSAPPVTTGPCHPAALPTPLHCGHHGGWSCTCLCTTPSSEADTSCAPHSHGDQNPAWVHFCADTMMAAPGTAHEQGASLCLRGATHASWSPGPKKRRTSSGPTSLDFEAEYHRGGNVPGINGLGCCGQRCHRDRTRGQEVSCDSPGTVDRQKSHLWPGSRVSQNEAGRAGACPFQTEKPGQKAEARG